MPPPPILPASFSRPDLEAAGFVGWNTWDVLRGDDFVLVSAGPAAYVVFRPTRGRPLFLEKSPAGHFKGRDPTQDVAALEEKWVDGARVIYIGKADVADRRLKQFARFGAGEPVGHWGGRYIWQLTDADRLLVAWHPIDWDERAREYERRLLAHFAELYNGARPFANLTG